MLIQLQYVLDREYAIAKEAVANGDTVRARTALQRRAYQRGLVDKTDQQLATLQELVSTVEFAQLEQSIVSGLEQGQRALQAIQKELSLERVDALMDRTADALDYQAEVDQRLAATLAADEQAEVDEALAVLAAEQRIMPAVPKASPAAAALPTLSTPATPPRVPNQPELV